MHGRDIEEKRSGELRCVKEVVKSMEVSRERDCVNDRSLPTSAGAAVRAAGRVDCSESTGDFVVGGCAL